MSYSQQQTTEKDYDTLTLSQAVTILSTVYNSWCRFFKLLIKQGQRTAKG